MNLLAKLLEDDSQRGTQKTINLKCVGRIRPRDVKRRRSDISSSNSAVLRMHLCMRR
jgi:hypothetical protein